MKLIYVLVLLGTCVFCRANESDWQSAVQTPEDYKRLEFFLSLNDESKAAPVGEIPKVFHVIWLGPKPLPDTAKASIRTWMEKHPDWKIKFWTDQKHPLPLDSMQACHLETFPLNDLSDLFYNAEDFDERSIILRYAILLNEGGICIDCETQCLASLETLRASHDFFCGLEMPGQTMRSSSINPSCHVLAATPHHPILENAKHWLMTHWQELEELFPGTDTLAVINRTLHRSVHALSIGIEQAALQDGRKDTVFPPDYFSSPQVKTARYALQPAEALFFRRKAETQEMQNALQKIHSRLRLTLSLIFGLIAVNVLLGYFLYRLYRKRKKQ